MTLEISQTFAELRDRARFAFEPDMLLVPNSVELHSGTLVWDRDAPIHPVRPGKGLILEFADLADATVEQIHEFAQKWGVLELCKHEKPATHNFVYGGPWVSERLSKNDKRLCCYPTGVEGVKSWRDWAGECRTILQITADLHAGQVTRKESWRKLLGRLGSDGAIVHLPSWYNDALPTPLFREFLGGPIALSLFVDRWLRLADVRPQFNWNKAESPSYLSFGMPSLGKLFGTLAIQLLIAISHTGDAPSITAPTICSSCKELYLAKRRPRAGESHYCPSCSPRAAHRDAARRYRQNQKRSPAERQYRQNHAGDKRKRRKPRSTHSKKQSSATA